METDLLIHRLCRDLRPARAPRAGEPWRSALLTSLATTAAIVLVLLGTRRDLVEAMDGGTFWLKIAASAWLCVGAIAALRRLAIPGSNPPSWWPVLLPPVAMLCAAALAQLTTGSGGPSPWLGASWSRCSPSIALLALPPLVLLFRALDGLAPVDRRRTGLFAGVAAGGLAATVYSLSCDETSAAFVLLWYGFGVALAAGAGLALATRLLRW